MIRKEPRHRLGSFLCFYTITLTTAYTTAAIAASADKMPGKQSDCCILSLLGGCVGIFCFAVGLHRHYNGAATHAAA